MLNQLNLFKIRLIAEVSRTESVLLASKALNVTPSAVSQNIKSLESVLGLPLFERVGKRLKPTALARELSQRGRRFFDELDHALGLQTGPSQVIRIGAAPLFGTHILMDQLDGFVRRRFRSRLLIHFSVTLRLLEDLLETRLDFAFIDGGSHLRQHREIAVRAYWNEELVMCCSSSFFREHLDRGTISLDRLRSLPHIPYHEGQEGVAKWYHHHFRRTPEVPFAVAVEGAQGVLRGIELGWGLGVIPKHLAAAKIRSGEIRVVSGRKAPLVNPIVLAQLKSHRPSAEEKEILTELSRLRPQPSF